MMHAAWRKPCSATGPPSRSRCRPWEIPCRLTHPWPKRSALPSRRHVKKWMHADANSTPSRSNGVEYKVRLDALVRRQIIRWNLPDGLLVDVYLRLNDVLALSPT